jgi:hypothetical protein
MSLFAVSADLYNHTLFRFTPLFLASFIAGLAAGYSARDPDAPMELFNPMDVICKPAGCISTPTFAAASMR